MARGRMINSKITLDQRINSLSDDTSRLAFTWLITFADCEGRTYGDPAVVRSMLFPRRANITVAQMERYIKEWADIGLVTWYEANNDLWIEFQGFEKNQVGLRKDREQASDIPAPSLRTNAGVTPEKIGLTEVKVTEINNNNGAKRAPSEFQKTQYELANYFMQVTGLQMPDDYKAKQKLWWTPAGEIYKTLAGGDIDKAKDIIDRALSRLRGKVTLADMNSVIKTCRAICGEDNAPDAHHYVEVE
jgi:hypothetical protein